MIIAITKENESLIKYVCSSLEKDVQVMNGVANIKKFAIQEMKNLNNYSNIIIDLTGINDTEEDIVDAMVALKSMYNIKIIVIATGYEQGNSLLAKLFNEGIYNFIVTADIREQEKELRECIEEGKQYKDAIRYRVNEVINNSTDKIIIKKEYKKLKQCVSIGVAGTQNHIGVTTQAIAITKFLNDLNMNACYIQANKNEDIETLETFFDLDVKEGFFSYQNIDFYKKDKTVNAMEYGYDFYVYDLGVLSDLSDSDIFMTKDVKIIVSGTKSWEQDNLMKVFDIIGESTDVNYLFNYTAEAQRNDIAANMGKLNVKTYFINYMPDPFNIGNNEKEYHQLLKEYIAEKSIRTEVIPIQKKKSFLSKFIGRREK